MPHNILLGVCGGISAYKSCELVREFQKRGAHVRVVMTAAATRFVTPLTFEALTHAPVLKDLFSDDAFGTAHIEVARWANRFVIAPLTANTAAKFASGAADDFLSTVYLAFKGPIFAAPAMNTKMWEHPTVRKNFQILSERGVGIVSPQWGDLACGEVGEGKMASPMEIADAVLGNSQRSSWLQAKRVVITAGPTREYMDPVRFLSSPSTGAMGIAVAEEAHRRGADVTLICGPTHAAPHMNIHTIHTQSAQDMESAVHAALPADVFVSTASVSDYRFASPQPAKIKRGTKNLTVELVPNPDILKSVADRGTAKILIGFAAETENLIPNAKLKLETKGADLVVANEVFKSERGFSQDITNVSFLTPRGVIRELNHVSKSRVASEIWDWVEEENGTGT